MPDRVTPRVLVLIALGCAALGFAVGCVVFYVEGLQDGICISKCSNPLIATARQGEQCQCE